MGTLPVAVAAIVPGTRPVIERVQVHIVAGPAARIDVVTQVARLFAGQQLRLETAVFSRAGDRRDDRVEWRSSAPAVARVAAGGVLVGVAPGKATIGANAGAATNRSRST